MDLKYYSENSLASDNKRFDLSLITNLSIPHEQIIDGGQIRLVSPKGIFTRFDFSTKVPEGSVIQPLSSHYDPYGNKDDISYIFNSLIHDVEVKFTNGVNLDYVFNPDSKLFRDSLNTSEFQAISSPLIDVSYLLGRR